MPLSDRIELDQVPPSFRPFAEAIPRQDDPAPGLIRLLGTLGEKAPDGEARDFALLLRRTLAQSARLDRVSEVYIRDKYPLWYIRAVNDRHRNAAYRRALQALVTAGVLELAAGVTGGGSVFQAFVPGLAGNPLTLIQPNSVLILTLTQTTTVVVSGVTFTVQANTPSFIPVGANVTITIQ